MQPQPTLSGNSQPPINVPLFSLSVADVKFHVLELLTEPDDSGGTRSFIPLAAGR